MTRAVLQALLSHWWRHPVQLATLLLGLALATALWSGVQAINAEARASYDRAAAALGAEPLAEIAGPVSLDTYVRLRRAGWQVTPVVEGEILANDTVWRVLGIEPLTAPRSAALPPLTAGDGDALAYLTAPGLLFVAPETMQALDGAQGLPPRRLSPNAAPGVLITDVGTAARLLGRPDQISRLRVRATQPPGLPPLDTIAPGLTVTPPGQGGDLARLTDSFHLNLTAFGFLSFAVGLFIVHGAIALAFEQRRAMIRTLRAIGVPLSRIVVLSLAELTILALLAGGAGLALGYGVAALLLPDVAATLRGLYGATVSGGLTLRPEWALAGLAMALIGTLVAGAQALWQLARLPMLAAAQPRAWARASGKALVWQGAGALALFGTALGAAFATSGLVAGFVALGGLLLGAALALPVILAGLLALVARAASGPMPHWFWADTRQQVPGLSLALMALLLALAANVGVSTMVSSFRLTFTGYLDQRLASELYVTAPSADLSQPLQDFLRPRVDAILPIRSVETRIAGRPAQIFGVVDHPTYRDNWPLLATSPGAWDTLHAGQGAMINEQLSYRADLAPGDRLQLAPDWQVVVAGVYSDYGNPAGQVIVAEPIFEARYPDVPKLRFGLRMDAAHVPALTRALTDEFGLPADAITDQATIKAFSLGVFERTFAVTGALNVLTLGVAGFALLTSMLTLSAMRLPQLAPIWALGQTRARLARLEMLRTLALAALTVLVALPVGLALAWVLLNIVNVEAFGWRLPMYLFPLDWARLGLSSLVAAALAAALPVRRLAKLPPSDLLKVFAHER